MDHYSPQESLEPAQRSEHQAVWLRSLVAHAWEHAPAARRVLERGGLRPADVRSLDDLPRIPITRKDELIQLQQAEPPFGGWLATEPGELRRLFQSPGPILDPQGQEPDYWRFAEAMHAAGLRRGTLTLVAVSYHLTPLGHMFDEALAALGCPVVPGGVGSTELQVGALHAMPVRGYAGTPSFLNILLEKADELGWRPGAGLALANAFVAAEMLPDSLRKAIQDRGVQVCQAYGTADLGCLAYECSEQRGMHLPASAIVEIVDPASGQPVEAGQPGEVVATVNRGTYPLLRFGTGDLSALDVSACGCGRTSPRLTRIMGRIGDAVKVRGLFVHPRQVDELLARFPEVQRCQLVVTRAQHRDELAVNIEAAESPNLADRIGEALRATLKVRGEVRFVPAGTIAPDARRILDKRSWE